MTGLDRDNHYIFVVKRSVLPTDNIFNHLKNLFSQYNSVSLDYEGDDNYLTIQELENLLNWLHNTYQIKKQLFYTIALRSRFDILLYDQHEYLQSFVKLYQQFSFFNIILIAGHKKYIDHDKRSLRLTNRFTKWVELLTIKSRYKEIFIGADNIFRIANTLLSTYANTRIILLKSHFLSTQLDLFDRTLHHRIGIYTLYVESKRKALDNEFIQSYLQRRGIEKEHISTQINNYAIDKDDLIKLSYLKNRTYWFLFLT